MKKINLKKRAVWQASSVPFYKEFSLVTVTGKSTICPEMQVNEMHALYNKYHKVSSFPKSHQSHIILSKVK